MKACEWLFGMRTACFKFIMMEKIKDTQDLLKTIQLLRIESTVMPIPGFNNFGNENYNEWNKWLTDCKELQ